MKTAASLITTVLLTSTLSAQTPSLDQIFDDFAKRETATTVLLSGSMFKMFADFEPEKSRNEFSKLAEKIQGIRIVIDEGTNDLQAALNAVSAAVSDSHESLMQVQSRDDYMEMYISEKDGVAEELFMTAAGDQKLVLVSVKGSIALEDVSKVSEKIMKSVGKTSGKSN